jgi:tetratricopeptide (TPR) repeat protein
MGRWSSQARSVGLGLIALGSMALAGAALGAGCTCDREGASAAAPPTASVASPTSSSAQAPLVDASKGTTDWQAEVRALDKKVAVYEKLLADQPAELRHYDGLIETLLERSSSLGIVSGLDRVAELGEEAVRRHPEGARAHLTRARARAAVHRFDEALADLDRAEKLGTPEADTRARRGAILTALGRFDDALPLLEAARKTYPNLTTLGAEASLRGKMGQIAEAERLFVEAEQTYRHMSPFALAWLYFERGHMWHGLGDEARASELYRAAIAKLPPHARAVGHLGELASPPPEITGMLRTVLERADDPEYKGTLGELRERSEKGSGRALIDEAKKGYDTLLAKHPAAFADHAGWFFLDIARDAKRAVELATINLKVRPQAPDAYELLIAALAGAGEHEAACVRAEEGLALKDPGMAVREAAAEAFGKCGKPERQKAVQADLERARREIALVGSPTATASAQP